MRNNKQSSVDWLINQALAWSKEIGTGCHYMKFPSEALEQAKAMHKDEMIQSYSNGWHDGQDIIINGIAHIQVGGGDAAGQQYYNETFGGKQ